jgi:MYXO-CTERM domain-containing protein
MNLGKLSASLALAATVGLALIQPANASHMFFQNVTANGIALSETGTTALTGSTITFSADVVGEPGDSLNWFFVQGGGTSSNPAGASDFFGSTPITFTQVVNFTGTYSGTLVLDIPVSFPDYIDQNGAEWDSYGFNFTVTPDGAVPEPSQTATMALGLMGLAGLVLFARKRRQTAA